MGPDDRRDARPFDESPENGQLTADGHESSVLSSGRLSRRQMLASVGAGAAVGAGLGSVPVAEAADAASATGEVGVAPVGGTASRLVGRIDQNGGHFVGYGYYTLVAGLSQAELFSQVGNPLAESTAYFTFSGTASLVQRSALESEVFVLDVVGKLDHYYNSSPSASFADPASFARGLRVGTSEFSLQDVLNVFAPNEGIAELEGPVTQLSSKSFRHHGRLFHFGRRNLRTQLIASGRGTRSNPNPPVVSLSLAGAQLVTS
jgi:hypothetical protein